MTPPPRFWVIADDLTGALDTAAPFAAHGWRTCVVPWPGRPPGRGAAWDVVVVDTASRHVGPREAARRVRAAVRAARRVHAADPAACGLYKKIDSTLRGNVAAELAAFRAAAGVGCLPLAPAFPRQGRTTRGGAVWVDGRPLARSAAARDVLGPAASGDLARLAPAGALDVLDAGTDADLRRIATQLARAGRLGAVAGSGGLAGAIAARFGSRAAPDEPRLDAGAGVLVVSGSAHPAARAQVQALAGAGALGLVVPVEGPTPPRDRRALVAIAAGALRAGRPVVLICPPLAAGIRVPLRRARLAASRLAEAARDVVKAAPVAALVAVGGDTTAAVVSALRWAPLAVDGGLGPGVATVRLPGSADGPRWLVTKAGGFGDPLLLRRLVRRLTSGRRSGRIKGPKSRR
jgi:uncharacterized protein YgbK (DUF1537 family)